MLTHRRLLPLPVLSALSGLLLTAAPVALADNGHGNGNDNAKAFNNPHPVVNQLGERGDGNAANDRVDNLIAAINNEVSRLSNLTFDDDNRADDDVRTRNVRTISLATLEDGLSSTDAANVTNAVNANSGALQSFLSGGSAQANAIDDGLNAAGISPSSALAIVALRNGHLVVITA